MTVTIESLGLIAGNRSLPLVFAAEARRQGVRRLVAVGFEGETDPGLKPLVDELVWVKVGQLSKMIGAFTSRGISRCVMAGQIAPRNLYEVRPDLRAMAVLLRLKERNAHSIFGAIASELSKDGVELIEATPWLKSIMPGAGFRLGAKLSAEQAEDLEFGYRIAKSVAKLEIGQSVVVKRGTVLAVEGFEGTDQCLARGGGLAGPEGGAVAVKVARENHDFRFDIPCIGPQTLETCAAARITVLGIESGTALLLEQQACEEVARKNNIAVATVG
ncbi:MAG TPA: UDP-2,3-diacylglucosamine diphosphatase LpxI [Verrucomicrobiae bacterium]|nr:UDP-2,3-diacylglucosamine diphosphatase LpxI [Verrucomicrobiae bacterium]